jgi:hypothetical protein
MKRCILGALIACSLNVTAMDLKSFFADADQFLKKYVTNGLVDYKAIKKNNSEIEKLYREIGMTDLSASNDMEKKAFYINAYNLVVVYYVSKYYPLKSPLDQSGFFDKVKHLIAGENITLNTLEIKNLLQGFKDARIHFALACAAKSCPPLASSAYTPDKLDVQLKERTVSALNNKEWMRVFPSQKRVELSKIFEWYKADFTSNGRSVLDWINQFRKEPIPSTYSIGYYEYNWSLNEK